MIYPNFTTFLKKSDRMPLIAGVILSIIIGVFTSGFYLLQTSLPDTPSYYGLAKITEVNDSESVVLFNNEPLQAEITNADVGNVVAIYSDNGFFTNDPSGHSKAPNSEDSVLVLFTLFALSGATAGFVIGFGVLSFFYEK
jgi:hypothetical protein